MARISDRKIKIIKRRYGKKSVSELAAELKLSEKDVRRVIRKLGLELADEGDGADPAAFIEGKHSLPWVMAAAFTVIICADVCYGATLRYPFVFDDHHSIYQNRYIRDSSNFIDFFTNPQTFSNQPKRRMFRPLVLSSYAVNYMLSGYDDERPIGIYDLPANWRLFNIAVHALNGLLVFLLLDILFGRPLVSVFLSALFVVHPAAVEPVVYLSSRSTLMAATFIFGALYCYFRFSAAAGGNGGRKSAWAAGAAVLFFTGLLCKENVFMLPATLIVAELLMGYDLDDFINKGRWRVHVPLWAIGAMYLLLRRMLDLKTVVLSRPDRHFSTQLFTQAGVWLDYLRKMLWPVGLNNQPSVIPSTVLWVSGRSLFEQPAVWFLTLGALFALAVFGRRNRRMVWGAAFAAIILLPETLITMNQLSNERRMYLPMFGMLVAAAAVLAGGEKREGSSRLVVPALLSAVVVLMAPINMGRAGEWRDERTLWFNSIRRAPHSTTSWHGLGYVYGQDAQHSKGKKRRMLYYNKALWALDKALATNGNYTLSLRLKGAILLTLDKPKDALVYLRRAVKLESLSHRGWYNLGLAYYRLGRTDDAIRAYNESIRLNQFYPLPHSNLAAVYIKKARKEMGGRNIAGAIKFYQAAIKELKTAQELDPADKGLDGKIKRLEATIKRLRSAPPAPKLEGGAP